MTFSLAPLVKWLSDHGCIFFWEYESIKESLRYGSIIVQFMQINPSKVAIQDSTSSYSPPATPFHQNISPANGLNPRPRRTIRAFAKTKGPRWLDRLIANPNHAPCFANSPPNPLSIIVHPPHHTPIIRYNCRLLNVFRLAKYNETSFSFKTTIYLRPSSHNPLLLYPFVIH